MFSPIRKTLTGIKKSMTSLGESVVNTAKSANEVSQTLKENNRDKSRSVANSAKFFRIRREAVRRREREDLIEAQSSTGPFSRAGKVITQSTRGFLGRIMDFLGTIILGWAVVNLPKIISAIEKLVERLQTYFGILRGFFTGTYQLISSFIGGVRDVIVDIATLDFEGLRTTIDIRMNEMNSAVETMSSNYDELVTELSGDSKDVLERMGFDLDDFKIPFLGGGEEEPEPETEATTEEEPQQEGSAETMETPTVNLGQLTNIVPTGNYKGIGIGDPSIPGTTSMRGPRWGRHHAGVDIGTGGQKGWYVAFRMAGTVSLVQYLSGYGNTVIIEAGGKDFFFAHLARPSTLRPGTAYNGEIIGEIGNTGGSKGEHLHFEVRTKGGGGGTDMDPMPYTQYLQIGRLQSPDVETKKVRLPPQQLNQTQEQKDATNIQRNPDGSLPASLQVDSPSSAEKGFDIMNFVDTNIMRHFRDEKALSKPVNRTIATRNIIINNQQQSTIVPVPIVMGGGGNPVASGSVNNDMRSFHSMQDYRIG